ncbi:M23 family metallopeptidase [Alteromonas sp. ASW11-130]|uniref:M23 family metallopeptidase n=1 Tax=Alteromonas sp. ASW11-130 TaxID=3015775 RepID=UPI00224253EB|nr:M23 family metallopeptidase [Alteromonas sp. ASW11-130]MCW8093239.1 M23 family metallopeptidase [Alteromonas sp. ASW11-130]
MKLPLACLILFMGSVQAEPGCFDDWFCITTNDGSVNIQLQHELPAVITVTSSALEPAEVTLSLTDTKSHKLGNISSPTEFWNTMRVNWTAGKLNAKHDNSVEYGYPLEQNNLNVVQGFNGEYSHQGASRYAIDFAAPIGTRVLAARGGKVIDLEESFDTGGPSKKYATYANYVVILHDDGTTGEYYHLKHNGVLVKRGDIVEQGQTIAKSGNTGFSSLPHLHFGVYKALPHGKYQSVKFRFKQSHSKLNFRR